MEITKPLVSICLPIYNGEAFLQEALQSIAQQTYVPIELIVSDDCSNDASLKIIEDFKEHVDFPVFIFRHNPSGIGANWNNCVTKSNGEYIKFLFQDDVLAPTCIEKMVAHAIKSKDVGLVYCKRDFIYNPSDTKILEWIISYANLHLSWDKTTVLHGIATSGKVLLRDANLLTCPTNKIGEPTAVLIKKEAFDKTGYFSEVLKQTLDIEYWYRLMKHFDVVYIDEKLLSFRLHDTQTTAVNASSGLDESNVFFQSMYQNLFWQLCWATRKNLFFDYHPVGVAMKTVFKLADRIKGRILYKFKLL